MDGLGRGHHPLVRRPAGRAWKPRPAGRPLHPSISGQEELLMSLRRGEHAPKCPHRRLIGTSTPSAIGYRCSGGEC